MKWIGQHIYDQISRFRDDVYLEDLSTTTETTALVVDSDGKISKNVTSGVNLANGADNRVVTAVGTNGLNAEANLTFDGTDATIATTGKMEFRDANSYIYSPTANDLEIVATDITLDAATAIALEQDTSLAGVLTINTDAHECLILNTDGNANNSPFMSFKQDGTRRAFVQHNDTDNTLKLASEYGNVQVLAAASAGSDGDTAYMQVTAGGVFRFGAVDNDAVLTADGNMTFRIDADNDETGQSFAFQNNASTEIANLNESGDLQIDGKLTCASRTLAVSSSTDGDHDGDVVYFGGTTSMTIGKIYHYKSDGTWEIVNADAVATSDGLLGVALGAASDTNGMLLRGFVTLDHDPGAIGDVLYIQSDNAGVPGNATATAPSVSGDCVRIIGYQVKHASTGKIWFNPDSTFVEVA